MFENKYRANIQKMKQKLEQVEKFYIFVENFP